MANDDRPEALVTYLVRKIKEMVADGEYPPGSRLSPSRLAAEFGVSHIPVREALSYLAANGYIEHRQSRGFYARELSRSEIEDIYNWRAALETDAYKLAVPAISEREIAEMRRITDESTALQGHEDRVRFVALNREFHFVAFRSAGSPTLMRLLNVLWDLAAPYVVLDLIESERSYQDHLRQIELFEKHDLDGILAAMVEHRGYRVEKVHGSSLVGE